MPTHPPTPAPKPSRTASPAVAEGRRTRAARGRGARVLGVLAALGTLAGATDAAAARRCIAIAGTNDVHGAIEAEVVRAQHGDGEVLRGGVLTLGGYVAALRRTFADRLLLVDAGDRLDTMVP